MGFELFPLVFPNFPETDDMRLFVDEVLPAFRQESSSGTAVINQKHSPAASDSADLSDIHPSDPGRDGFR